MKDNPEISAKRCASCNYVLSGVYCSNCGEKVTDLKDLSFLRFVTQTLDVFSNFDFKFLKNFLYVVIHPGYLTVEYLSGRRINYKKPLQFFLIINVLYFIIQPFTTLNIFNTSLDSHRTQQEYSSIADEMITQKLASENITYEIYRSKFDSAIDKLSKSLIILNIPLYSLLVYALGFRKRKYFGESIVFTIHFYTFVLIFNSILLLFFRIIDPALLLNDAVLTIIVFTVLLVYLYIAIKKVYSFRSIKLILSSILLSAAFFLVLSFYRIILFFVTFYFT